MGTRRHTPSISASGLCPPHPHTPSSAHLCRSCLLYQHSSLHPLPSPTRYSQSTFSSKLFCSAPRPSFQLQVLLYLFIFLQLAPYPCVAQLTHIPATTTQISTTSISSSNGSSRLQNPILQVPNPTTPRSTTFPAAIPIPASQIDPTEEEEEEEENSNKAATSWMPHKDSRRESLNKNYTAWSAYHLENNLTSAFLVGGIPACGLKCIANHLAPGAGDCLVIMGQQQRDQPRQSDDAADFLDGSTTASSSSEQQRQKDCLCAASATTSSGQDDDLGFYPAVLTCVEASCNMEDAIETARGAWETCGKRDGRSRKSLLWVPLSAAIPALICVLVRLYSRWWAESKFEADDYIMMVVTILFIPFEVIGIFAAKSAFGRDIWTVQASNLTTALKLFYVGGSFYFAILTLTKLSILVFYLRIFSNHDTFRKISYGVMLWAALSGLVSMFLQIFQCTPIAFIWEGWKRGAFGSHRCIDVHALGFTTAAMSIAQDLVIIIMPLPLLAKLNVSRRCRLGIMIMFSLGVFVLITSSVRLWSLYSFGESANPTWDYTDVMIWTGLEVAVSIIVTSLPAIRVLINRRIGSVLGTSGAIWGPNGEYRGYANNVSTSSFGDTGTFVGSVCTSGLPRALKRLSAISHVSSLKVERLTGSTWGFSYQEEDEKDVENIGQCSQAIDFGGEKLSAEIKRMSESETDHSYSRRTTFEGQDDGLGAAMTRLSPRPNQRPLPYPPPPRSAPPERPKSQASSARPLPHPPQRPRSECSRPLPYPPAQSPAQIRPQGPRPLSQPERLRLGAVRRGGLIAPLPNIADVMNTDMSSGSLPAQLPPLSDISAIPLALRRMTIRKVEEGT